MSLGIRERGRRGRRGGKLNIRKDIRDVSARISGRVIRVGTDAGLAVDFEEDNGLVDVGVGGEEGGPRGEDLTHGGGVEVLQVEGVGVLVFVLGALGREQALGGQVRQVAPCVIILHEVDWTQIFPRLRVLAAFRAGTGVDEVDVEDRLYSVSGHLGVEEMHDKPPMLLYRHRK